jgi:hypothetical protein
MKIWLVSFVLFANISLAGPPDLKLVRSMLEKATTEERTCRKLIEILQPYNKENGTLFFGYRACATMMMAQFVFNPFSKISYFKKGRNMLESAIAADPGNVELRLLRFCTQMDIPSFLGYNDNLKEDKVFLLNSLSSVKDKELKEMITKSLKRI